MIIVADASPLIALARVQRLALLRQLYTEVLIPPAVQQELRLGSERPGAQALAEAIREGWLRVQAVQPSSGLTALSQLLDAGEVEAILLAEQIPGRLLLIDDRQGRAVAKRRGLPVVGIAGVLLAAKKRALLPEVRPVLTELAGAGYRLSARLIAQIVILAGE